MSRSTKKTITVDEEFHAAVKKIAERNGMEIKEAVEYTFKQTFPNDFPEKIIA